MVGDFFGDVSALAGDKMVARSPPCTRFSSGLVVQMGRRFPGRAVFPFHLSGSTAGPVIDPNTCRMVPTVLSHSLLSPQV